MGGLDDPGPALGEGVLAAFDASGRLHVLDGANHRSLVFDRSGQVVREYGRQGRGPGEFGYPTGFGVTPEGVEVIADLQNRTLVRVESDGRLAGTTRSPDEVGFPVGRVFVEGEEILAVPDPDLYASSAPGDTLVWRIRAYHLSQPRARTWREAWRAPEPPGTGEPLTLGGRTMTVRVAGLTHLRAFWPRPRLARAGDLLALFDSTTYRIHLLDPDGGRVGLLERGIEPVPVTDAFREEERARRRALIDQGRGPRFQISSADGSSQGVDQNMVNDFVREQIAIMAFWPEIPVLRDMIGSPDGLLWVQRSGPDGGPGPIDLMDTAGEYLGTLPEGSALPVALGPEGLAAYLEIGALGVRELRVESWKPTGP